MKTDRHNTDLEQLLDALERDGRNARRQQRLADMIDGLAAKEKAAAHRMRRMWTMRIAAAACVFFFIATAVRVWFIPTEQTVEPQVARAEAPVADTTTPMPEARPATTTTAPSLSHKRKAAMPKPADESSAMPEELLVEAAPQQPVPQPIEPEPQAIDQEAAYAQAEESHIDSIAQPVSSLAAKPEPLAQATPKAEPKPHRSLWKSLFGRTAPSEMDGTMLAINIL